MTVLAGQNDDIFPLEAVEKSYSIAKEIFEKAGVAKNCKLVVMPAGHRWCPDVAWKAIGEVNNKGI